MKLMREPRAFNLHTSRHIMRLMGRSDDKWRKYLFYLAQPRYQHSAINQILIPCGALGFAALAGCRRVLTASLASAMSFSPLRNSLPSK